MCEPNLTHLSLSQLPSINLSLGNHILVVFFTLLDLLLYLFEQIRKNNPITPTRRNLFLEIVYPGYFLIGLLQNLLNIVLYFMRLLKVLLLLNFIHMLLILFYLFHLILQDSYQLLEDFLCNDIHTFFYS